MKTAQSLVEAAMAAVKTIAVDEARALHGQPGVCFVDLREAGELRREGLVPGAINAPRGLIEFWFDPASVYARAELTRTDTRYVLFCALGWRSALAAKTLQDMGVAQVCHIEGGFDAWRKAGAPVTPPAPR